MPPKTSSKIVVYAALAGNLAIAVIKFVAAAITGSSAMLSEGVHSLVDTFNELLLLYGMAQADKPLGPDQVVAALSAEFFDALTTPEIEACINRIETAVKVGHPSVSVLFVKPQTKEIWRQRTSGDPAKSS